MTGLEITIETVSYNAAEQTFEGLVTVSDAQKMRRYPCAIAAPITMSFETAAQGLSRQAFRKHTRASGVYSQIKRHAPSMRKPRRRFDPRSLFALLTTATEQRAA